MEKCRKTHPVSCWERYRPKIKISEKKKRLGEREKKEGSPHRHKGELFLKHVDRNRKKNQK